MARVIGIPSDERAVYKVGSGRIHFNHKHITGGCAAVITRIIRPWYGGKVVGLGIAGNIGRTELINRNAITRLAFTSSQKRRELQLSANRVQLDDKCVLVAFVSLIEGSWCFWKIRRIGMSG